MSNELSIACVTRALRNRLNALLTMDFSGLPTDTRPTHEIQVTTLPLDRVRKEEDTFNQINLFLFQAELNQAFRNRNLPQAPVTGDLTAAPLALNLRYILTVYSEDNSDLIAHVLLGAALRIFHENPVLTREELADALALSNLDSQIERVRITPEMMSLEETSKLWTGFQSDFRLSASYQVSVILIESSRPQRSALPVLRIGPGERGAAVFPISTPSLTSVQSIFDPSLLPLRPASGKPAAELGDRLVLAGTNLTSDGISVRFSHRLLSFPIERTPLPGTLSNELTVNVPDSAEQATAPGTWPIGIYLVSLRVQRPSLPAWTTNQIAFALAPTIASITPETRAAANVPFDLTITCVPQVRERQSVSLLFGDHEIGPESITTPAGDLTAPTTLVFHVATAAVGTHVVRLRVDGVESIPIDFSAPPPAPPSFDTDQMVTITP